MSSKVTSVESLEQDAFDRDTELWSAFLHSIVDDPEILNDIPDGAAVILLPDDDPELLEMNLQRGLEAAKSGADVYIRHFVRAELTPLHGTISSSD